MSELRDKIILRRALHRIIGERPINVLLIEDNPGYTDLIGILLTKVKGAQFNLECVNQLWRALERLGKGNIDVILLDLSLPDSKGLDTFFKVFDQAPGVPIILLTITDDETLAIKAVQAGAQDYLIKGQVDGNLLVRSIHYAIERHRIQEELRRQTALKLQSSEARFRNVLEKNADGIVVVNKKGIVLFVNPAAEAMFGRRAEDLLGKSFGYPVVAGEATELEIVRSGRESIAAEMCVVETEWENDVVYLASLRDISEHKRVQEVIRETNIFLRNILDSSSSISIISTDLEHNILFWNKGAENIFGYKAEEVVGQHKINILYPDDEDESKRIIEEVRLFILKYKKGMSCEIREVTKDGRKLWINLTSAPRFDENGNIIGLLGIGEDISERKRAQQAIVQAKQEWESTFDTIEEMIFLTDSDGTIRRVNRVMAKKIGVTPEDLVGKRCQDVLSCGYSETEQCCLWRLKKDKVITPCEVKLTSLDIWVRTMAYASYTPQNELDYIVIIYRDITEERQREEALWKTEEHLRIILEGVSDGFAYVDKKGIMLLVNDQMKEILRDPHPEGKLLSSFCDHKDQKILADQLREIWKGKGAVYEIELVDLTRQCHTLQVSGTPYRDKNGVIQGVFGIYHDKTQERETKKALSEFQEALNRSFFGTAEVLSKIIENRDPYTSGHSTGVAKLAAAIARRMKLSEEEVMGLYISGILHDIGKMAVPVEILVKPGRLTELEMALIRMHPLGGYDTLKKIEFPWPVAQITLQHHERINGTGYPHCLKGEEIIPGARILAVADVVDAMTHHRPYRPAWRLEKAMDEISQGRGSLYDPQVIDACLGLMKNNQALPPQNIG
jgi:PAS domain S-box-containing protein